MNNDIINKILIYAKSIYTPTRRWQILDQFEERERDEAKKTIDALVESGDLFCIKGDTPATEEAWCYFSRQLIDDRILETIANGLSSDAVIERLKDEFPEEYKHLPTRIRMLVDAGAIKEHPRTFSDARLPQPGNQEHKTDEGKPLAGCLLEFGQALEALASVATHGATRYGRGTWKRVERQRYIDALMRHVLAMGPECSEFDTDSGLPHIVHVLWNAAAIIELKEGD